jgi:hypothetical protein
MVGRVLALPAAWLAVSASHAHATPVTFAQYVQQNGNTEEWTVTTSGSTSTITAQGSVFLSFSGVSGLPFSGPQSAEFTFTATSTQLGNCGKSCGAGDSFVQPGYTGSFSIIDTGSAPGTDLLSGVFSVTGSPSTTGAQFSSSVGSSGGSFNASATAGNLDQLVLSSQYLTFANETDENASFSLSSLIPNFSTGAVMGNQAYPSAGPFDAAGTGTFSSNPGPTATVPEPSTVSLLGVGLLGLGFLVKRGRRLPSPRPTSEI